MGDGVTDGTDPWGRAWPGWSAVGLRRRTLLRAAGLAGGAAVASLLARGRSDSPAAVSASGAARRSPLNSGWLFGGNYTPGTERVAHNDRAFAAITLPHTVADLSWGDWSPAAWEQEWIYRRHLDGSLATGDARVFVEFDGVMVSASAILNDEPLGSHEGGYLPWTVELTGHLVPGDNVLAVIVDSRCLAVPPVARAGNPGGIDYLQPGGIYRDASVLVVPRIYLSDVFACPVNVLTADRRVDVQCTTDAAVPGSDGTLAVDLLDDGKTLATATRTVQIPAGSTTITVSLTDLGSIGLWSPDEPKLYTVRATLSVSGVGNDTVARRIGFREAAFRSDGFYLNGRRLKIFGLNRHQLYPYTGMAMGARLQRRDAEILRYDLNCNMVRCSHYPQSPHFLDACDELGLMVWEEAPGWQQLGDRGWQNLVVQNVRDMVVRDRSRPSVIVWGTRLDETRGDSALYTATHQTAHAFDGSRPTAGASLNHSAKGWIEEVFGFDDYHHADGNAQLMPPLAGVPYLISEAVGALDGPHTYRWNDSAAALISQARLHAQVHHLAAADPRYAGVLAWAGIDYASLNGGKRVWQSLKTPGVLDTFRVAKPGAALYRSQVDPAVRPVILPVFFWDSDPDDPSAAPGRDAMIATNCDRLEIYAGGRHLTTAVPDKRRFGGLRYPPAFADLSVPPGPSGPPDLRIEGYLGNHNVATTLMSADRTRDRLQLTIEDNTITADGHDTTRATFHAADVYGNIRRDVAGEVALSLTGPAILIGDNPFPFSRYGPVGGAFIRSLPDRTGSVLITAQHSTLGTSTAQLTCAAAAVESTETSRA